MLARNRTTVIPKMDMDAQVFDQDEYQTAWWEFFQQHKKYVIHLLRRCGLPKASQDDCAQEVWLEVVRRLPEFRRGLQPPALLKWLAQITRAKAADWHRQERRWQRPGPAPQSPASNADDPTTHLLRQEQVQFVHRGLRDLRAVVSASTFFVIQKRCLEGHSVTDVSRWIGKKPQQVWDRQRRGLQKLKAILLDLVDEL